MKRLLQACLLLTIIALQACVSYSKVETGEQTLERLRFKTQPGWNSLSIKFGPAQQWSREGLPIDRLLIYSGVENGAVVHPVAPGSKDKPITFQSTMQLDQLVSMFDQMHRMNGSTFEVKKSDVVTFAGKRSVRFEYLFTRKNDNVRLNGIGYAMIDTNKLYAMLFQAPRLHFYPKEIQQVEAMMASARLN